DQIQQYGKTETGQSGVEEQVPARERSLEQSIEIGLTVHGNLLRSFREGPDGETFGHGRVTRVTRLHNRRASVSPEYNRRRCSGRSSSAAASGGSRSPVSSVGAACPPPCSSGRSA